MSVGFYTLLVVCFDENIAAEELYYSIFHGGIICFFSLAHFTEPVLFHIS